MIPVSPLPAKSPFEFELKPAEKLLRTRYTGVMTASHMKSGADQIGEGIATMPAGFTVFADLSGLDSMELDCAPHLARIMDYCRVAGVARVIRVVPDRHKDIGMNILSLIHYRGKIPIITCDTLEEGERALK